MEMELENEECVIEGYVVVTVHDMWFSSSSLVELLPIFRTDSIPYITYWESDVAPDVSIGSVDYVEDYEEYLLTLR